jgi:AraC family transcriptional regulator
MVWSKVIHQNKGIDSQILLKQNATIVDQIGLNNDLALSRWSIDPTEVTYQKDDSHTLSIYLSGGETSFRADKFDKNGAPGALCLMPEGHRSTWSINGNVAFAHLYFTDRLLKQFAAMHFDCDIRFIDLIDLTYGDDAKLRALLFTYFTACETDSEHQHLFAEQALFDLLYHLTTDYNGYALKEERVNGGLSPKHLRRAKAHIRSCLDQQLSLEILAQDVGLSPYHFARMFKTSVGETPARFIMRARVEGAKQLLQGDMHLAEVSAAAGFSHQSHMSQQFKKHVGVTPMKYRSIIKN